MTYLSNFRAQRWETRHPSAIIHFCEAAEISWESERKVDIASYPRRTAQSAYLGQMSNRSMTCTHLDRAYIVALRTHTYTHLYVHTHARVIHSVTISRKSIIKPLSCRGYNGRGKLFWSRCIVLVGSPVGLELSARYARTRRYNPRPRICASNVRLFARMTRIIEMDVD